MGFEVFVHPDRAVALWNALMEEGKDHGLVACGLGARDSLRTEAGLPLYGHEMGGDFDLMVGDAGFISFVRFNSLPLTKKGYAWHSLVIRAVISEVVWAVL